MSDRLKEICLEINRWMKTDPNSVKLKLLFAERQELKKLQKNFKKRFFPASFTKSLDLRKKKRIDYKTVKL